MKRKQSESPLPRGIIKVTEFVGGPAIEWQALVGPEGCRAGSMKYVGTFATREEAEAAKKLEANFLTQTTGKKWE
jgi:hypothetical protein